MNCERNCTEREKEKSEKVGENERGVGRERQRHTTHGRGKKDDKRAWKIGGDW